MDLLHLYPLVKSIQIGVKRLQRIHPHDMLNSAQLLLSHNTRWPIKHHTPVRRVLLSDKPLNASTSYSGWISCVLLPCWHLKQSTAMFYVQLTFTQNDASISKIISEVQMEICIVDYESNVGKCELVYDCSCFKVIV